MIVNGCVVSKYELIKCNVCISLMEGLDFINSSCFVFIDSVVVVNDMGEKKWCRKCGCFVDIRVGNKGVDDVLVFVVKRVVLCNCFVELLPFDCPCVTIVLWVRLKGIVGFDEFRLRSAWFSNIFDAFPESVGIRSS